MGVDCIIKAGNIESDDKFIKMVNGKDTNFLINTSFRVYGSEVCKELLKESDTVRTVYKYEDGKYTQYLIESEEVSKYIDEGYYVEIYDKLDLVQFVRNLVDVENLNYMELSKPDKEIYDYILDKYEDIKDLVEDNFYVYSYYSV